MSFTRPVKCGVSRIEGDPNADNARQFAYEFFTRPNKYLGQSAAWAGGNEFKGPQAERRFCRDYAEKLRQMAPRPPFEFVYATELTLGRYDPKLGGFPLRGAPNLRDLPFGSLQPSPDFQWPELLLPIHEAGAQRLLDRLQAETTRHGQSAVGAIGGGDRGREAGSKLPGAPTQPAAPHALQSRPHTEPLRISDASASPRPTADILSQLLAPPPGAMPIRLPTIEGRPILRSDQVSENFLDLVAVGQFPDLLSERQDPHLLASREIPLVQHLLTPDAQRQVLENPVFSGLPGNRFFGATGNTGWKGEDEFAQRQSQQSFERIYLPKLKDFAPKGPFEFALVNYAQLPEYDFKRGGFALGKAGVSDLPGTSGTALASGVRWLPQFEPPDLFWPLDAPSAERLTYQLEQAAARRRAFGASASASYRELKLVLIVEASRLEPDPDKMALRLKAVHLYTQDLGTMLYKFPGIGPEPEPYLTSAIPAKLDVPSPAPLDAILLGFKYIEALADKTPDAVYAALWQLIATRDEAFYYRPDRWAGLTPNDARRPFFPRGGAERTQPAIAAFRKWAKAYVAGLPATVFSAAGLSGEQQDGSRIVEPLQGGRVVPADNYAKLLTQSHLQADQLISIDNANFPVVNIGGAAVPVLFAMPNRWSLYTFKSRSRSISRPASCVSTFKLGAARLASDADIYGRTVLGASI